MTTTERLNERIEKTKHKLTFSAPLYQDEVILLNQIAIMETLIEIKIQMDKNKPRNFGWF